MTVSMAVPPSPENSCQTVRALSLLAAPPLPLLRPQPVSATADPARTASDVRVRLRRADIVVTTLSPIWIIRIALLQDCQGIQVGTFSGCPRHPCVELRPGSPGSKSISPCTFRTTLTGARRAPIRERCDAPCVVPQSRSAEAPE